MATSKTKAKAASKSATAGKRSKAKPKHKKAAAKKKGSDFRVKVRMYRQGLGDCFLITIPTRSGKPFYVLIDCGVILGTKNADTTMKGVVQHIIDTTNGHINLLAATHEHWDHISGFGQARELWTDKSKLTVDQVWLSWAEDPKNPLAQKLKNDHIKLRLNLQAAVARMGLAGNEDSAREISSLLGFFGAAGSTPEALETVRQLSSDLRYCKPAEAPITLPGTDVKVYVLGPPPDERLIKKYNPSTKEPETYGINAMNHYMEAVGPALESSDLDAPFDDKYQIPLPAARQMPFFDAHYWGEDEDSRERNQSWGVDGVRDL